MSGRYTVSPTSGMRMNGNSVHVRSADRPGILATVHGYGPGGDEIIGVLSLVLDADPDAPTACSLCESGGRVFHVHPKTAPHPDSPTADAPAHPDFSPGNMARLREAALQNYIDTADAPADTDLQPGLFIDGRNRICELREVGGTWQHPSTTTEPQCVAYPPERLIPESQVRAQVEAARRDALNEVLERADDGNEFGPSNFLLLTRIIADVRHRAARGETRQPADTDTGRGQ